VQICQVTHAAIAFAVAFPELTSQWYAASNTLVVLAVADELDLGWLCDDAHTTGLKVVRFHEPDFDDALTAAAFEPAAARMLAHLPLALAQRREVKS